MTVFENLNKTLAGQYATESLEKKTRIVSLFYTTVALAVLAGLLPLLIQSAGKEKIILAAIALLFLFFAVAVLRGKGKVISPVATTLLAVALATFPFTHRYETYYEVYLIGALTLFVLGITVFIGYHSWQIWVVVATGSLAVIADSAFRVVPSARANGVSPQIDDAVINVLLISLVATCLYVSLRRSDRFIREAVAESERSGRQLAILRETMAASRESLALGGQLTQSARDSSALAAKTSEIVGKAEDSMAELTNDSRSLARELTGISESSKQARASAENESSIVNQTSAAVEEMTASIKNIAEVTQKRKEAVTSLSATTEKGQKVIAESSTSMQAVQNSASSILDIIKVISSVASQTNLLAMNAAIEAAHAGEYGRGFSVVADEIRKLSEQTGKSVRAVSETVKATLADIKSAAESNDTAVRSFAAIANETLLVADAMDEIIRGLDELAVGTGEINQGVANSVTSTNALRAAVGSVDERIAAANDSLEALGKTTAKVLEELSTVQKNADQIARESNRVEEIGKGNESGLLRIQEALRRAEAAE